MFTRTLTLAGRWSVAVLATLLLVISAVPALAVQPENPGNSQNAGNPGIGNNGNDRDVGNVGGNQAGGNQNENNENAGPPPFIPPFIPPGLPGGEIPGGGLPGGGIPGGGLPGGGIPGGGLPGGGIPGGGLPGGGLPGNGTPPEDPQDVQASLTVSPDEVAAEDLEDFVFTLTSSNSGLNPNGSQLTIAFPAGWPAPLASGEEDAAGLLTAGGCALDDLTVDAENVLTVPVKCGADDTLTLTQHNVTVPDVEDGTQFTFTATAFGAGEKFAELEAPVVTVTNTLDDDGCEEGDDSEACDDGKNPRGPRRNPAPQTPALVPTCAAGTVPAAGFLDVPADHMHAKGIDCLKFHNGVRGLTGEQYGPGIMTTRGQMASMLAGAIQASGVALPQGGDAFSDDNSSVHERAINQLAAARIVDGTGAGRFSPRARIRRDQVATMLVGAYAYILGEQAPSSSDHFDDDRGNAHESNINAATDLDLVVGTAPRAFEPGASLLRDQMATMLANLLSRLGR